MYAQHRGPSDIPRNYSGNAFRYPPIGQIPIREEDARQPDPPEVNEPASGDMPPCPLPTPALPPPEPRKDEAPPAHRTLISGIGQLFGNEELLLIGLFLLLSGHADEGERQGNDLLFYLLLLLFCG